MNYYLIGYIGLANNVIVSALTIWRTIRWYQKWELPETWRNYTFKKKFIFHLLLILTSISDIPLYIGFITTGEYTLVTYSFHKFASTFLFAALSVTISDWAAVLHDIQEYQLHSFLFRRATLISINVIYASISLVNFIFCYSLSDLESYTNSPIYQCAIFLQIIMNVLLTAFMLHAGLKLYARIHGAVGNIDSSYHGNNRYSGGVHARYSSNSYTSSSQQTFLPADEQASMTNSTSASSSAPGSAQATTSTINNVFTAMSNALTIKRTGSGSNHNVQTLNPILGNHSNHPPSPPHQHQHHQPEAVDGNMELKNALNNLNFVMATCTICILLQIVMITLNYALGYADKPNKTVGPPLFYWACSSFIPLWGPVLALLYLSRTHSQRKRAKFASMHRPSLSGDDDLDSSIQSPPSSRKKHLSNQREPGRKGSKGSSPSRFFSRKQHARLKNSRARSSDDYNQNSNDYDADGYDVEDAPNYSYLDEESGLRFDSQDDPYALLQTPLLDGASLLEYSSNAAGSTSQFLIFSAASHVSGDSRASQQLNPQQPILTATTATVQQTPPTKHNLNSSSARAHGSSPRKVQRKLSASDAEMVEEVEANETAEEEDAYRTATILTSVAYKSQQQRQQAQSNPTNKRKGQQQQRHKPSSSLTGASRDSHSHKTTSSASAAMTSMVANAGHSSRPIVEGNEEDEGGSGDVRSGAHGVEEEEVEGEEVEDDEDDVSTVDNNSVSVFGSNSVQWQYRDTNATTTSLPSQMIFPHNLNYNNYSNYNYSPPQTNLNTNTNNKSASYDAHAQSPRGPPAHSHQQSQQQQQQTKRRTSSSTTL